MRNLVVGIGTDTQHASEHPGIVVNRSVDLAGVQGGDRRHTHRHRNSTADGQRVGLGIGRLVRTRGDQHRAWRLHIGGLDESLDHWGQGVARDRARRSGSDHAEAGGRRAHAGVGRGRAHCADGDVLGGIDLAQPSDALCHRGIGAATRPGARGGLYGVEGIGAATGKGDTDAG